MSSEKGPVLTRSLSSNREGEELPAAALDVLAKTDLKSAKIKLYEFNESPPCWKVRALLHFYGLEYESVIAFPGAKVEGIDNTYHKIPKLVIDDVQINDSAVIFRTLAPLLTGKPLSTEEVELEQRNNIRGLLGALEKETVSSYWGIANATRVVTSTWSSWAFAPVKPVLPYLAGLIAPVPMLIFSRGAMPHGKDGPSITHGHAFRAALGTRAFFHGEEIGPLDLSLYGSLACFLWLEAPAAAAVLDRCDLRRWYERCDAKVKAVRALNARV